MKYIGKILLSACILLFLRSEKTYAEKASKLPEFATPQLYIQIDGKKISSSDVEKEMGDEYENLVSSANDKLFQLLETLGIRKMLRLEAAEKKLSVKEYTDRINNSVENPSEEELLGIYQQIKNAGQTNEPFENIRSQILDYLISEGQEKAMREEISRLKKKYHYVAKRPYVPKEADIKGEPTRGSKDAPITIVEFTDFECPFCIKFQATSKELRKKYGDKIKWVVKDFPLQFHQKALGAHIAANCVLKQGQDKYWNYFDSLFTENRSQETLTPAWLTQKAKDLKVDMTSFNACLTDESIQREIQEDVKEAARLGMEGTPSFLINGRMISGALDLETFEALIESSR
ncbi:DsbA family protein [Leptospira sarikeiensis]|uniref:DsbA family protein n=1 Tax=Leptospira sarikeiensis TaxID=2484943 RepID=A0A4R9K9Q9_9LEPT|nr:DsbA family protein [Leptospira sarikeiensis]TGL63418.1 DsbA family protein [Leptospira sarikeiensis]